MKLAALLPALLLLAALPARAAPRGLSLEGQVGLVLLEDGQAATESTWGGGLRAGADIVRGAGAFDLRAELSWLHFSKAGGTTAVRITPTYDELLLAARAGLRVGRPGLQVIPYVLAGPALTLVGSEYLVRDPVAGRSSTRSNGSAIVGVGYGLGLALVGGDPRGLQLATRLEGVRLHRGTTADAADMAVQLGIGIAF